VTYCRKARAASTFCAPEATWNVSVGASSPCGRPSVMIGELVEVELIVRQTAIAQLVDRKVAHQIGRRLTVE
jgi:hypothetical protein